MVDPSLRRVARLAAAVAVALSAACSSPPPPAPAAEAVPALDLRHAGAVGVLDFSALGEPGLAPVARDQFLAAVRAAQPGATLRALGAPAQVLASVGATSLDAAALQAIGQRYQLGAVLVAEVRSDEMDPYLFMRQARAATSAVEIGGLLSAQIFETRTGTAIWSTSATGRQPITRVQVNAWGIKSVDAAHLQEVRLALVKGLVTQATADFRPQRAPGPMAVN